VTTRVGSKVGGRVNFSGDTVDKSSEYCSRSYVVKTLQDYSIRLRRQNEWNLIEGHFTFIFYVIFVTESYICFKKIITYNFINSITNLTSIKFVIC